MQIGEYPGGGYYTYFSMGEKTFYAHIYDYSKTVMHCLPLIYPVHVEIFACDGDSVLTDNILKTYKMTALAKSNLIRCIEKFRNPF